MFKTTCLFLNFCLIAGGLFTGAMSPCLLAADSPDWEEQEFAAPLKTDAESIIKQARSVNNDYPAPREVKFTAGKDKLWFTSDDEVYHLFLNTFDAEGRIIKRECFKIGKDVIPFTADDELQESLSFEYSPKGVLQREVRRDGKGMETYSAAFTFDRSGRKIKVARHCFLHGEDGLRLFSYDKDGLLSRDVTYMGERIEKYQHFDYDSAGRIKRAMEYHYEHNGSGADAKWFTADDQVSSTKEFIYNTDGSLRREDKHIGSGPDNKWFTEDDILQYYVVFSYD